MNLFTQNAQNGFELADIIEFSRVAEWKFDDIAKACAAAHPNYAKQDHFLSSRIYRLVLNVGIRSIDICVKFEKFNDTDMGNFCIENAIDLPRASTDPALPRYLFHKSDSLTRELATVTTWLDGEKLSNTLSSTFSEIVKKGGAGTFLAALRRYPKRLAYSGFCHRNISEENILLSGNEPRFLGFTFSCRSDRQSLYTPPGRANLNDAAAAQRIEKLLLESMFGDGLEDGGNSPATTDESFLNLMKRNGTTTEMFHSSSLKAAIAKLRAESPRLLQKIVFSGSSVLCALGLRPNKDVDVFHFDDDIGPFKDVINSHNYQLRYLGLEHAGEIILNPKHYFMFEGAKILSPALLKTLKENRLPIEKRSKDAADVQMLNTFLAS
jgi:serine/threonine protein kinase